MRCQVRRTGSAVQRTSSNGPGPTAFRELQVLRSQLFARCHPCLSAALPSDFRRFTMVEGHDCPRRHIRRLEAMLPAEGDAVPSRLAQKHQPASGFVVRAVAASINITLIGETRLVARVSASHPSFPQTNRAQTSRIRSAYVSAGLVKFIGDSVSTKKHVLNAPRLG